MHFGMDEMFGESHDYDVPASNIETGKTPRVVIDMARGNVRVTGVDATDVKVGGRKSVRAMDRATAATAFTNTGTLSLISTTVSATSFTTAWARRRNKSCPMSRFFEGK